jgi:putative aldouronate transport system substrate-binding protein
MRRLFLTLIAVCLIAVPMTVMAGGQQGSTGSTSDGPVEIHVGYTEVVGATWAEGEDQGDNLWTRLWLEEYNIKVIADWVSAEYDTTLNLAIASKKLPDAFIANPVQFQQLAEAGLVQDLQEAYDNHASPGLRRMMDENANILDTARFNGELLAIPRLHYGYETSTPHMWARKDWLEGLGIPEIKTVPDIENLMDSFKSDFGAQYGLMLDRTLRQFLQMAPTWHSYPQLWVEGPKGDIVYGATLPETKEALAQFAEWYKEGYIRPDFATLNSTAMFEDAYNGRTGMYTQQNWAGWQVGSDMFNNQGDNTFFMPFDLPSIDGKKVMYPIKFPNSVYSVVNKKYDNPEVLIQLISSYVHVLDEAMVKGDMTIDQALPFATNNMHHVTGPFKVHFNHYNDIKEVSGAVATGVEKFSTGNAYQFYFEIRKWIDNGDLVGLGRYIQMGMPWSSLVHAIEHVDNDHELWGKMWGVPPQSLRDYGSTLDDLLIEGYTHIITGTQDIGYFDELIESWKKAGGDQVTAQVNEMYGK